MAQDAETVTNQSEKGCVGGTPSSKASLTALWGPKATDNTVELDLDFRVQREKPTLKLISEKYSQHSESQSEYDTRPIQVKGLISKFAVACGRTGTDRQFFYVNGRPCNLTKVQKAFNEVYRTFNANQSPFILADFIVPAGRSIINS
jgi:DNA mismatch repair protein PMS2